VLKKPPYYRMRIILCATVIKHAVHPHNKHTLYTLMSVQKSSHQCLVGVSFLYFPIQKYKSGLFESITLDQRYGGLMHKFKTKCLQSALLRDFMPY
jgi:hypothetical protein